MKKNLTIDTIEAYKKVEERHTKDVENAYKLGQLDALEKLKKELNKPVERSSVAYYDEVCLDGVYINKVIDRYIKELQDSIVKVKK